jgi:hypothetical protein
MFASILKNSLRNSIGKFSSLGYQMKHGPQVFHHLYNIIIIINYMYNVILSYIIIIFLYLIISFKILNNVQMHTFKKKLSLLTLNK